METKGEEVRVVDKGPMFGVRHVQVLLLFLLLTIGVGMRSHLSVAIVAMTDNTTSSNPDVPTYDWNNKSIILSSYFWAYAVLQLLAGELSRRYSTKKVLIVGMFINSTSYLIVPPVVARLGSYGLISLRVIQGMSQGLIYPSIYNQLGRWAPTDERSRLGSIALSGSSFGTIVTMPLVGYISSTSIGWPITFYLYGSIGFFWIILWFFLGADTPATHWKISAKEKAYIESSLHINIESQKLKTPWKSILTSLPVHAIVITYLGQNWGYSTLSTEMPTYLNKVMKLNLESNSILSSVPFVISFILGFFCGSAADYLINNRLLSRGNTRKLFTSIASVVSAVALFIVCYLPDDAKILSVSMLLIPLSATAAQYGGSYINHVDLSPNYAGIILAISNSIPNMCSIFGPIFVQVVVIDESDKFQWRIVFIISALMYLISDLFYVVFASGEVQSWNDKGDKVPEKMRTTEDEQEIVPLKSV